ncbi:hypothetical protein SNE40_001629 [Patella caerulea]|uniref:Uncharacterized protein n=1 Tax=Patella caerulea TaxID=87958 RepID=A0AAN8KEB2_PATCE
MVELKVKDPLICSLFEKGLFVVRRSDRFWAGRPKDLVIEQSLMRPIKSIGGLVHGRGVMDEIQRNKWILSMPACSAINDAMTELSLKYKDNLPHKDCSTTRVKRDNKDGTVLLQYLIENNPFDFSEELRDISSGQTASSAVNCHHAYDMGLAILNKINKLGIDHRNIQTILFGNTAISFDENSLIVEIVHNFIKLTKRFKTA